MIPSAQNTHAGASLIEILVVLGIVGILAVLLIPVFGKIQETSEKASCLNNLRQWGVAINLYATDHNLFLPTHQMPNNLEKPGEREIGWDERLAPYASYDYSHMMKNDDLTPRKQSILVCPAEKEVKKRGDYTYAYNFDLNYRLQGNKALVRVSTLNNASRYMLMTDSYQSMSLPTSTEVKLKNAIEPERRHNGIPNFLYADGHAAPFTEKLVGYNEVTAQNRDFYYNLWFANGTPPYLR